MSRRDRPHVYHEGQSTPFVLDPELLPWEQQAGEPALWYSRFELYLRQGPERSIGRTYRECDMSPDRQKIPDRTLVPKGNIQVNFANASKHFCWKARAAAWDKLQIERARKEWETERLESRNSRIQDAKRAALTLAKVFDRMDRTLDDDEGIPIGLRDLSEAMLNLSNALKNVNNELRIDYNDLPKHRVEVDGEVDVNHTVTVGTAREALLQQINRIASRQGLKPPTIEELEPEADVVEAEAVREV